MTENYSIFRAFIASPGDVAAERQLAEETILKINNSVRDTLYAIIEPQKWEQRPPIAPNLPAEKLQDILNREIERCNFFILILYKRYGTTESGYGISNTEREIELILKIHEKHPQLRILSYFRELHPNVDPGLQEEKVRELRKNLEERGIPYRSYRDPNEFNDYLTHDLYDVLLRIRLSPFKKQALSRFWRFGITDIPNQPRLAVLYPPVERQLLSNGHDPDYWLNKLSNQVAFEDYKAIQKIEKNFHLLGFKSYKVYPLTNLPSDMPWMNRVWLCVPRNKPGLRELSKYRDKRFEFPDTKGRPQTIIWRLKNGRRVEVASPMSEYLRQQRSNMDIHGEWHAQLSKIIAKDFAIVARFQRSPVDDEERLWDYFFAGIRGLGTWGAAWYIDREPRQVNRLDKDDNVQLLLEVTYQDGRILQVTNVSDFPANYFRAENDPNTIRKRIDEYKCS